MSDYELYEWTAGWKPSNERYFAGQEEMRRRNNSGASLRAWIATGISALALAVALFALFD
jgi:hypothetical protein